MSVRAFIAVDLPPEAIGALAAAQAELRSMIGRLPVKWARAPGMHLTLRFFGDVPEGAVRPLGDAVGRACAPVAPFDLELGALGCFPPSGRARVIWAGLAGDLDRLGQLRAAVAASTDGFAADKEDRVFVPHLTLGRVGEATRGDLEALGAAIASVKPQPVRWRVGSARLVRSILRREGAEHVTIAECRVGEE